MMRGFGTAGSSRLLAVVPVALVAAISLSMDPAGATTTPTPAILTFKASPTTLKDAGGTVTFTATMKYASKCTLSVSPKVTGLPSTSTCKSSYSKKVTLPKNATGTKKVYTFGFSVKNSTGTTKASDLAVGVGAAPPPITFTPASLSFGTQGVGIQTTPVSVTIRNNSTVSQELTGFSLGGTDETDFGQDFTAGNCAAELSPGQSCQFLAAFSPLASGARTAYVAITDLSWGASGTTVDYHMSGTGQYATVSLSDPTLSFGDLGVRDASGWLTETVTNSGTVPLKISTIEPEGNDYADFAYNYNDNDCDGATITPGSTCYFQIQFTPSSAGLRSTDIVIFDNTAGAATKVPASGTGEWTSSTLSSYSIDFPDTQIGTAEYAQITITNTSTYSLVFGYGEYTDSDLTGNDVNDFSFIPNPSTGYCASGGEIVAPEGSCIFEVEFDPLSEGQRSATLYLYDNTDNATNPGFEEITLSGTGEADS
jgi:hypothetical protein